MVWTPASLAGVLSDTPALNIETVNEIESLIIKMNDYGDLQLNIVFTSHQLIIETYICPVREINNQDEFNLFLLRNQKLLPLSSVGISLLQGEEYYVAFGALSLHSSLDDILLEISALAENAIDLAEITDEFTH
ncbi:YjfI family protein [Enterobacter sp. ENT03]|uniref:YjfI family protein n=1 Tax=Enterobacter sp. ENT03 TaxID=2854780 RepID=UPI001C48D66D|nr:DUF2170 family protein [Enterobacter sp. ENT03]MBV7405994.1 DUF2170 family protein [Enterobacter sp. ENT03]